MKIRAPYGIPFQSTRHCLLHTLYDLTALRNFSAHLIYLLLYNIYVKNPMFIYYMTLCYVLQSYVN
jgi:hypothetical protein